MRRAPTPRAGVAHNFGMAQPEGYRKARRLMELAGRFGLPMLTFVDTSGAYPGHRRRGARPGRGDRALDRGLPAGSPCRWSPPSSARAARAARIALAAGDAVLMLEHAIYSVISPEGCAAILWRDAGQAADAAEALKLTAQDLQAAQADRRRSCRSRWAARIATPRRRWPRWARRSSGAAPLLALDPAVRRRGGGRNTWRWGGRRSRRAEDVPPPRRVAGAVRVRSDGGRGRIVRAGRRTQPP